MDERHSQHIRSSLTKQFPSDYTNIVARLPGRNYSSKSWIFYSNTGLQYHQKRPGQHQCLLYRRNSASCRLPTTKSGNNSRPLCYATSGRSIGSDGHGQTFHNPRPKKGYYQVLVEPEHQTNSTFITEFGKYQFRDMPVGLRNAPATFQQLMDLVLKDTTNFAKCYIDDISVYSQAWTEHIDHIREVLTSLQTAGLTLQLSKCKLGAQSCEFLGHHVSAGAISPQTAKVEAIINFRRPLQKKDVRSFLGLIGYYRRYIPQFSSLAAPLSDLTKAQEPDTIK